MRKRKQIINSEVTYGLSYQYNSHIGRNLWYHIRDSLWSKIDYLLEDHVFFQIETQIY